MGSVASSTTHRPIKPPGTQTQLEIKFEEPVHAVEVCGGKAVFVKLGVPVGHGELSISYVGKDAGRARSEAIFYESVKNIQLGDSSLAWGILDFIPRYAGLHSLVTNSTSSGNSTRTYMAIEDVTHGYTSPRLVDIKLGSVTADLNWYGKGCAATWRSQQIDKLSNSGMEGYRLEGFENYPPSMSTLWLPPIGRINPAKLTYQRFRAREFLSHFFDLSTDSSHHVPIATVAAFKLAIHLELIRKLAKLLWVIQTVPVPQKWVGSSMVVCFDLSMDRSSADHDCLRLALVDWERSELLSRLEWDSLDSRSRADRVKFWGLYKSACSRLLLESARLYYSLYCQSVETPGFVVAEVYDYDSVGHDDMLGSAIIPFVNREELILPLRSNDTCIQNGSGIISQLCVRVAIDENSLCVRITILSGSNLPESDMLPKAMGGRSDPYVKLKSPTGTELGRSKVCRNTCNPEWGSVVHVLRSNAEHEYNRLVLALQSNTPIGFKPPTFSGDSLRDLLDPDATEHNMRMCAQHLLWMFTPPVSHRTTCMNY